MNAFASFSRSKCAAVSGLLLGWNLPTYLLPPLPTYLLPPLPTNLLPCPIASL